MIRYESVRLTSRIDLLTKIESFLGVCGWQTHRKSDEILYASDSLGGGLVFKFISYKQDSTYGYGENSIIYVCNTIKKDEVIDYQSGLKWVVYFKFQELEPELDRVYLIGDDKNFVLFLDCEDSPLKFNMLFCVGYITKSHEFNGGRVAYSSCAERYNGGYNWGGFYSQQQSAGNISFGENTKTIMKLGGAWETLYDFNGSINIKNRKILTNLINKSSDNQLSALSAVPLLNVGKSALSGLYTMITPNFFYLNNQNVFVHAGDFDFVRVLKDDYNSSKRLKNGQILHLGDEKFIILKPCLYSIYDGNYYIMAVKIA